MCCHQVVWVHYCPYICRDMSIYRCWLYSLPTSIHVHVTKANGLCEVTAAVSNTVLWTVHEVGINEVLDGRLVVWRLISSAAKQQINTHRLCFPVLDAHWTCTRPTCRGFLRTLQPRGTLLVGVFYVEYAAANKQQGGHYIFFPWMSPVGRAATVRPKGVFHPSDESPIICNMLSTTAVVVI